MVADSMTSVRVDLRPAYELVLSLVAFSTPDRVDSYEVGPAWLAETNRRVGADLRDRIHRLTAGCDHILVRLLGVALQLPPPGTAEALLDQLRAMPPAEMRLTLLGYYAKRSRRRVASQTFEAAVSGQRDASRALIDGLADGPECERGLAGVLALDDQEAAARTIGVVRDWTETIFTAHWEQVGPILEREADRLRGRALELSVDMFLDEITRGADVVPGPGLDEIEVFPMWVLRPWNVFWEHGSALLLGVPVADEHVVADPEAPPERLVALAKALGDERRLRILRRLTVGSYTLQELADHFATPKTTLLHHLVMLRSAGIVRVGQGANGKYGLRTGMSLELYRMLDRYLPAVQREPVAAGVAAPARARDLTSPVGRDAGPTNERSGEAR